MSRLFIAALACPKRGLASCGRSVRSEDSTAASTTRNSVMNRIQTGFASVRALFCKFPYILRRKDVSRPTAPAADSSRTPGETASYPDRTAREPGKDKAPRVQIYPWPRHAFSVWSVGLTPAQSVQPGAWGPVCAPQLTRSVQNRVPPNVSLGPRAYQWWQLCPYSTSSTFSCPAEATRSSEEIPESGSNRKLRLHRRRIRIAVFFWNWS